MENPPKRAGCSNWKAQQSWKVQPALAEISYFANNKAANTKIRNVVEKRSHMWKANVCGPKRAGIFLGKAKLSNFAKKTKENAVADAVMLQTAIGVPQVDRTRHVDAYTVLPRVGDKVKERRLRLAGHCVRNPKPVASKLTGWEPTRETPRRGKRCTTYVDTRRHHTGASNTADLLMNDRKVWRAEILESRRTGVMNPSTKTTLSQKLNVVTQSQPVRVDPPLQVAPSTVPEQAADVSMKEAFFEQLLTVEDIDAGDSDNPQLCAEYVNDIYAHLMDLEVQQAVRPEYLKGCNITPQMRALLIGWMIMIRSIFELLQETLYLSVAIFDRFLQVQPVSPNKLQLVGVTAMLLASKYEEKTWGEEDTLGIKHFASITDNAYTTAEIRQMERMMLRSLNFDLGRPLPLHFLRRASKAASSTMKTQMLASYLMELTLLDYEMVHYQPSEIAAASLCLSQLLDGLPWTPTEHHYTTYDEAHLQPIIQHMAKNVVVVNEGKTEFQMVKKKYSGSKLMSISLLPELQSAALKTLAAPLLDNVPV